MVEGLREELAGLSAKLERSKKVDAMLKAVQFEELDLVQREKNLKTTLSKEQKDVDNLMRTTATSLLYSLIGKKAEKFEKEHQEAYAAYLKYVAAVNQLKDCRARKEELKREADSLSGCAGQYERTFAALREQLHNDPAYAERLCALERQRGGIASQMKELNEAVRAGEAASMQIETVERCLGSAENWSTWDLLGGGLISDMAKHSKLDEAQAGAEFLQILLSRFHTELADIHINAQMPALNAGGFLRFADFFFDGLIADLSVRSRIHESQVSVSGVRLQVSGILLKLSQLKKAQAREMESVEKRIAELILSANPSTAT